MKEYICINAHKFNDISTIGEENFEAEVCPVCKSDQFFKNPDLDEVVPARMNLRDVVEYFHTKSTDPFFGITRFDLKFICYKRDVDNLLILDVYHHNKIRRHYKGLGVVDKFKISNMLTANKKYKQQCDAITAEIPKPVATKTGTFSKKKFPKIKGSGRSQHITLIDFENL